ncbi:MAG: serine hydrolase domain-containing protein [Gammaproteobacteria bacterium]
MSDSEHKSAIQDALLDHSAQARLKAAGLDPARVVDLLVRARREVDEGLLPGVQLALARDGAVVFRVGFGAVASDSLFSMFSATKAVTSAAIWLLLQEQALDLDTRVVALMPEFAAHDKGDVTIEHLLTHTAGFPGAPFRPADWLDPARRTGRWQQWRLTFTPGSRFEYHPTATMWVLAELIERRTGRSFLDFVRETLLDPLDLPDLHLGLPAHLNHRVVPCMPVGSALTEADYAALGLPPPPVTEVTEEAIVSFNDPAIRAIGVPGGGGITDAASLALFWQGLLHGGRAGRQLFSNTTLKRVRQVRTGALRDPVFGTLANRGLGIVIAGDETRIERGFGHTHSAAAIGHNGAGGQIAWADPATGLSFAYLTGGHDRNRIREARRSVALSSLAAAVATPQTVRLA